MADDQKTIELKLKASTEELEAGLSDATRKVKRLEGLASRLRKGKTKDVKKMVDLDKKLTDTRKQKKGIDTATQLKKLAQDRLKILKDTTKEASNLNKELQKTIQLQNKATGGKGKGGGPVHPRRFSRTLGGMPSGAGLAGAAGAVGAAGLAVLAAAVGAAIGTVSSQINAGYGAYSKYARAQGGLVGSGTNLSAMRSARHAGVLRGYGPAETMQQARAVALQTGQAGQVTRAQDIARTTMLDVGGAASFMGQLTRAGNGFGGKAGIAGRRQTEKVIAAGFKSGLDRARIPEFIQGVGKLVEQRAAVQGGNVKAGGYAKMLAAMGMTGASGMQGTRGVNVLSKLDQAIQKPGGGEYGQALMLQAFGFGKPGGNATYYEALKRQEQGAMNVNNVKDLFKETRKQYGGGDEQILALRQMTGLSITQLENMRGAVNNLDDKGLKKAIEKAKPVEEQSLDQMKIMGKHVQRIARLDDRLVGIGEEMRGPLESMQDSINTLVEKLLPIAKTILDTMAQILEGLTYLPGFKSKQHTALEVAKVGNTMSTNASSFLSGKMSYQDYDEQQRKQRGILLSSVTGEQPFGTRMIARSELGGHNAMISAMGGKVGSEALQDIFSGDVKFKDPAVQKRIEGAKQALKEAQISTPNNLADDAKVLELFKTGGMNSDILQRVVQVNLDTANQVNRLSIEMNKGTVKDNPTPKAKAETGREGG